MLEVDILEKGTYLSQNENPIIKIKSKIATNKII